MFGFPGMLETLRALVSCAGGRASELRLVSMLVAVVQIGAMRVHMLDRFVGVLVGVTGTWGHGRLV